MHHIMTNDDSSIPPRRLPCPRSNFRSHPQGKPLISTWRHTHRVHIRCFALLFCVVFLPVPLLLGSATKIQKEKEKENMGSGCPMRRELIDCLLYFFSFTSAHLFLRMFYIPQKTLSTGFLRHILSLMDREGKQRSRQIGPRKTGLSCCVI